MKDKLITTAEAAKVLGVNPSTVLKWAKRGRLSYMKVHGNAYGYDPEEVQRLAAKEKKSRNFHRGRVNILDRKPEIVQANGYRIAPSPPGCTGKPWDWRGSL